jgi:hypothetical protein
MVCAHADDLLAERIQGLFESMDKDNSGVIDKYELKIALEELGITLRPRELNDMVKKYDVDRSGTIDFEEFLSMIKELVKKAEVAVSGGALDALGDKQLSEAKKLHDEKQAGFDQIAAATKKSTKSMWLFSEESVVRRACTNICKNKLWDKYILFCIFVSTVCLAIENPMIGENSPLRDGLNIVDLILNASFTLECLLKIISMTFVAYIKVGWNKLDFLIVSTSLIDMSLTYGLRGQEVDLAALKIFRIFRIFRALRPLRIIARAKGLRILVGTLMASVKPVLNTVSIALAVFSVFGVLGMQLLSGKLYQCSDNRVYWKKDCIGHTSDGDPREWINAPVHFDNSEHLLHVCPCMCLSAYSLTRVLLCKCIFRCCSCNSMRSGRS